MQWVTIEIKGEPASKANSRRLVTIRGMPRFIKSAKALSYLDGLRMQVRKMPVLMSGDLEATIDIWYASRRPDLDESVILDGLQGLIYENDRQIVRKVISRHLDRENPRATVTIKHIGMQHV